MIAEELHFGRAAQRLFVAQPSVSQQLRKLEDELGVRLVHRSSRTVRLTPAGSAFLAETDRILSATDRAVRVARQAAAGQQGALRIAANYPASRLLLLPLLEELRAQNPGVTTMLRELSSPDQIRELLRGDLDIGLIYGPADEPTLASRHLIDVPVIAVVRPGHPLAGSGRAHLDSIASFPYVTSYTGGSTAIEDALLSTAARHHLRLRRSPSITDLSGYLLELETTDAIGFSSLPRGEQTRANGMHLLQIEPAEPSLEIHVAWNPSTAEPLVNTAVDQLTRLAGERSESR